MFELFSFSSNFIFLTFSLRFAFLRTFSSLLFFRQHLNAEHALHKQAVPRMPDSCRPNLSSIQSNANAVWQHVQQKMATYLNRLRVMYIQAVCLTRSAKLLAIDDCHNVHMLNSNRFHGQHNSLIMQVNDFGDGHSPVVRKKVPIQPNQNQFNPTQQFCSGKV